jgi:hypothetical protein
VKIDVVLGGFRRLAQRCVRGTEDLHQSAPSMRTVVSLPATRGGGNSAAMGRMMSSPSMWNRDYFAG